MYIKYNIYIDKAGEDMTKKTKLIISVISFIIMILMIQCNVYAAKDTGLYKSTNITTTTDDKSDASGSVSMNKFNPEGWSPESQSTVSGASKLESIGNNIIGPIRIIGSIVSVVTLIILGIKYIFGSVEEKAEYKKTMMPYLIGAVMVFAITNLLNILVSIIGGF